MAAELGDCLVGNFSHRSLLAHFEGLQASFVFEGTTRRSDVTFYFHSRVDGPAYRGKLQLWWEAPHLALTGTTEIGENGVIVERVACDLKLASDSCVSRFGSGSAGDWKQSVSGRAPLSQPGIA